MRKTKSAKTGGEIGRENEARLLAELMNEGPQVRRVVAAAIAEIEFLPPRVRRPNRDLSRLTMLLDGDGWLQIAKRAAQRKLAKLRQRQLIALAGAMP